MRSIVCLIAALVLSGFAIAQPYAGGGQADPKEAMRTLSKAQDDFQSARKAYSRNSKDSALKAKYVAAMVTLGTESMHSPILDRKEKYKQALTLYRRALKLDPNNEEAKANSEMIVMIYKQMGRPVPKG